MKELQLIIAAGLLGYFLQCGACILGIYAVAKKRIQWRPFILATLIFSIVLYFIRTLGKFNFGIHTMLTLLLVNTLCVLILRIDVRPSILGSLLVTALVLLAELFDYSMLMLFFGQAEITVRMEEPLFKAWAAVPGNILLVGVVVTGYILRVVRGKKAK